jgi:hypothetical protein
MISPLPVCISRPSESCTSGRQSLARNRLIPSEYQSIEVSGAMPNRSTERRI